EGQRFVRIWRMMGFILLGVLAGIFSGIVGVGGGIIIVPALVFLFGMSQQMAQGTTLALLVPPIGILAAWTYYKHGYVDLKAAALICAGFVLGSLFGSKIAVGLTSRELQRAFGGAMLLISLKLIFFGK